jgi:endo-1,4-beta-D-glucanase Y
MRTVIRTSSILVALLLATPVSALERWPLWQSYAKAFVDQGRVIDHQANDKTTSEGEAYGLFFSLVANDRSHFDAILNWTQNNLGGGDLATHLPAWEWGRSGSGEWKVLDANSASDADLWMAYALLEAGRLWREPRYLAMGHSLSRLIAQREVATLPGFGAMLLPGAVGFHPTVSSWLLNPSYLPLPVVTRMAHLDPAGPWQEIASGLPKLLALGSRDGFAMDWIGYTEQSGFAPAVLPSGGALTPEGSYDAIRVYLWAGMTDPDTQGAKAVLDAVPGMANLLSHRCVLPERVSAGGSVSDADGPPGFTAASLPYFDALHNDHLRDRQQMRLRMTFVPATGLYGQPPSYYDQNLAMFGEGWMEHRFRFGVGGELEVKWNAGGLL